MTVKGGSLSTGVERSATGYIGRVNLLLGVQSLIIILLSLNRLTSLTLGYVASNQFLRWVDFNNMLILPLVSVLASYLLKRHLEIGNSIEPATSGARPAGRRAALLAGLGFIAGVYLLGAGYGDHEVTNYLHVRFCSSESSLLCDIIAFNDDQFSHFVFFIGFILINVALLFVQVLNPSTSRLRGLDLALLVLNGLFIGAGIFANLAFEQIGLDLYVVALLAALSLYLLWRRGVQPLSVYYSVAYTLGLLATVAAKFLF